MEIQTQWDAAPLLGKQEYTHFLQNPPTNAGWIPPSLSSLDSVLEVRRPFFPKESRAHLVTHLLESHRRRQAPPCTLENIERLKDIHTYIVITGQQPGLLGGPLLTLYKTLHAVTLARKLSAEREETFIPAFWNASEDHDFEEIASAQWLDSERKPRTYKWKVDAHPSRPHYLIPASELPLEEIVQTLRASCTGFDFLEESIHALQNAHAQARSYPDFFDTLLWKWFETDGLLILRPDDVFMRAGAWPILAREIQQPQRSPQALEDAGEQVRRLEMAPQIHKRSNRAAFFVVIDGQRRAVDWTEEGFRDDTGQTYNQNELWSLLQHDPTCFSPSAILRPIAQDALLPVAAAVLGPSEMAYHFLLDGIYRFHEIPRPCLVPRIGFTVVEPRDLRILNKLNLSPKDLREDTAALVKRITREQNAGELESQRTKIEHDMETYFNDLKQRAQSVDPTIVQVLEKNRSRIVQELQKSEELLIRRQADRSAQVRAQVESTKLALLPGGILQERPYNAIGYWMKYGPYLLESLREAAGQAHPGEHLFISF